MKRLGNTDNRDLQAEVIAAIGDAPKKGDSGRVTAAMISGILSGTDLNEPAGENGRRKPSSSEIQAFLDNSRPNISRIHQAVLKVLEQPKLNKSENGELKDVIVTKRNIPTLYSSLKKIVKDVKLAQERLSKFAKSIFKDELLDILERGQDQLDFLELEFSANPDIRINHEGTIEVFEKEVDENTLTKTEQFGYFYLWEAYATATVVNGMLAVL